MSALDPNSIGALMVPNGGTSLPTASGAGEVPVSTGAGTTYTATTLDEVVLDGTKLVLTGSPAGDALVSDGAGDVATRLVPSDHITLGTTHALGSSAAAYLDIADATPAAAPTLAAGQSLAVLFRPVALPAGGEVIVCHGNEAASRGFHLYAGYEAADRGHLSLYLAGLTGTGTAGTIPLAAATFAGELDAPHVLVIAHLMNGTFRYSWDGGTVQVVAAPTGTYAPPTAGDPMRIGQFVNTTAAATSVQFGALRTYSTILSDADLVAIAGELDAYRLAAPSAGTLSGDVHAAQFRGASTVIDRASGQRWRLVGALLAHEQA